ncbi:hypothetical protein FRB90_000396 [Tulasnella sp. 427]|nr:hypothetical protein FRB90_000396 [Tulasnella sp. 427]
MSELTLTVTLDDLAKMIDMSLFHPEMTDDDVRQGLQTARTYEMAAACVKPDTIPMAVEELQGSSVLICPVIGFPDGDSTTAVKVFEAQEAVEAGGKEIDMVINLGKALDGDWDDVEDEIRQVNDAVTSKGAILKVVFEAKHVIRICKICSKIGVAFIKTTTGYGLVMQPDGFYTHTGTTWQHFRLMKEHAEGVRTLDDLLKVRAIGVTRVGTTVGPAILAEAENRGIGGEPTAVQVSLSMTDLGGSAAF